MDTNQLKYMLEDMHFSANLPAEVLDHLAAEASMLALERNGVLFRENAVNNHLYLVRQGRLALEMSIPGRGAVRILTLGPGEMVGWSALLGRGKMTASALAVEPSEVICAPADKLLELCDSNREFGFHLMRRMAGALSNRLVATRLQLLDLFADLPGGALSAEGDA